jgi:hypothetical protein
MSLYTIKWATEDADANLSNTDINRLIKQLGYTRRGNIIESEGNEVGRIIPQKQLQETQS